MNRTAKVLYVEDDELDRRAFLRLVREKGLAWEVMLADTLAAARTRLAASHVDAIVADYHLPDGHCTELFDEVPDIPFVLLTGTLEEQLALRTLERGADDYLPKDPQRRYLEVLPFTVEKTLCRRRILERERKLSRELAQTVQLLDLANVLVCDLDDRIIRWNTGCQRLYGFTAEQVLGQVSRDLLRTQSAQPLETIRSTLLETGRWEADVLHTAADGRQLVVHSEWVLWRDAAGEPAAILETNTDITGRKQAEEALRAAEAQLRSVTDTMAAGVSRCSRDLRYQWVSRAYTEWLGRPAEQIVGRSMAEILGPAGYEVVRPYVEQVLTGQRVEYEAPVDLPGLGPHWMHAIHTPTYDAAGAVDGWVGVVTDITRSKGLEESLRDSRQQLQDINQTLEQRVAERTAEAERRAEQLRELASELTRAEHRERSRIAGILHDHLQQLLVGAKFGTSVLREQLAEVSQRRALQKVDDLLDESLETSRNLTSELSPSILREGTLAAALRWLASWMHDKHGLAVHLKTDETLNPQDEGVRILLFESVRELLFNIVKHAATDSACATLERCDGEHLRIIVADAGPGFDPAQHRRHDRSSGGFGLFSIRERLGLIGGRFEIDSAPGQGAQMTLVAPLRLPSAEPVAPALTGLPPAAEQVTAALLEAPVRRPTVPGECTRIRVLVADDHAVVRDGLAQLLQMHADVDVVGLAGDGQQAIELASSLRPDVILMDVSMPRLSGIDATRRVRLELPQVSVIGLSMHAEDEMASRMREAGAVSYLTKTAPPDAVVAAIRSCFHCNAG